MAPLKAFLIVIYILALVIFTLALIQGLPALPEIAAVVSFIAFVLACRVHDKQQKRAAR